MSDKRPLINIDFGWLETLIMLGAMGLASLLALLVIGLTKREPAAYMVVGGFIAIVLMGVGGFVVLGVMWFSYRMERGREGQEQERFVNNARENLAIMQATARTQATQNQMLLRQGRELARALPSPDDTLDVDALVFDNAIFEELED